MQRNPYTSIIGLMRAEGSKYNPPSIILAEVFTEQPTLTIKLGNLQIGKENLLIADYLLNDYERDIEIPQTTDVTAQTNTVSTHSHTLSNFEMIGKIKFMNSLKSGDLLAIMPTADKQTFVVLCRVVRLT